MTDCLFCKIVAGKIPCTKVYESEHVLAFRDIHPAAPVHVLVVPKQHIATANDVPTQGDVMNHMLAAVHQIARNEGVAESGYRLIMNVNADGGQVVYHVHWHILGGKKIGALAC